MAGRRQEGIARSKGRSGTRGEQERGEQNGKIGLLGDWEFQGAGECSLSCIQRQVFITKITVFCSKFTLWLTHKFATLKSFNFSSF